MCQAVFSAKIGFLRSKGVKGSELLKAEGQGKICDAKYHRLQKEKIVLPGLS
jgi:hypothetical protein